MTPEARAARDKRRAEYRLARAARSAERQRRAAICNTCPHATEVMGIKVFCGRCLCPLASKTRDPYATCPAGKW